jgi:hypothetical protein
MTSERHTTQFSMMMINRPQHEGRVNTDCHSSKLMRTCVEAFWRKTHTTPFIFLEDRSTTDPVNVDDEDVRSPLVRVNDLSGPIDSSKHKRLQRDSFAHEDVPRSSKGTEFRSRSAKPARLKSLTFSDGVASIKMKRRSLDSLPSADLAKGLMDIHKLDMDEKLGKVEPNMDQTVTESSKFFLPKIFMADADSFSDCTNSFSDCTSEAPPPVVGSRASRKEEPSNNFADTWNAQDTSTGQLGIAGQLLGNEQNRARKSLSRKNGELSGREKELVAYIFSPASLSQGEEHLLSAIERTDALHRRGRSRKYLPKLPSPEDVRKDSLDAERFGQKGGVDTSREDEWDEDTALQAAILANNKHPGFARATISSLMQSCHGEDLAASRLVGQESSKC